VTVIELFEELRQAVACGHGEKTVYLTLSDDPCDACHMVAGTDWVTSEQGVVVGAAWPLVVRNLEPADPR
jgi:hypothetical protein